MLSKIWVKRAIRTFIQTAIGYVAVNFTVADLDTKNALIGLAISAVAAGMAAVMNIVDEDNKKEC